MLPKKQRLTKKLIDSELRYGKKLESPLFKLIFQAKKDSNQKAMISVVASKKVAPKAIIRNKLRRRGYSSIKPLINNIFSGVIAIVHYKKSDYKTPIPLLTTELESLFKKAKIM